MHFRTKLKHATQSCNLKNLPKDAQGLVLAELMEFSEKNTFLYLAKNDAQAQIFAKQFAFFCQEKIEILQFPAWDCLPFERISPKPLITAQRVHCLERLIKKNKEKNPGKIIVISTINAILQKTIPHCQIANFGFTLEKGEEISLDDLTKFLVTNGFERSDTANNISEFAVRGSIIDIITRQHQLAGDLIGYRLDLFGNEIEKIRVFDPLTQITNNEIKKISLLPAKEINLSENSIARFKQNYRENFGAPEHDTIFNRVAQGRPAPGFEHFMPLFFEEKLSSFFEYLHDPLIFADGEIFPAAKKRFEEITHSYQNRVENLKIEKRAGNTYQPIKPNLLYLDETEFESRLQQN